MKFRRNADSVEEDEHDDEPIEALRLDGVPDGEPEALLGAPEGGAPARALCPGLHVAGAPKTC